jgi:DNA-binding NarL/FixJ family response regulator
MPRTDRIEPLDGAAQAQARLWLRDMGALVAMPAMWVDHEPAEIVTGLLGVLSGILGLDGAYVRFDDSSGGRLEQWRPVGEALPPGVLGIVEPTPEPGGGAETVTVTVGDRAMRLMSLPLSLPWGNGLVAVWSARDDFPSDMQQHLLRVAVGQAAIAIHTAGRLAAEQRARAEAEAALERQTAILRSLLDEVEPSLTALARQVREASREVPTAQAVAQRPADAPAGLAHVQPATAGSETLSRREAEVLGLLAQGMSNKEIAGTLWLSVRTVERHVTSLYRKIGVVRRSEATAFAIRHSG